MSGLEVFPVEPGGRRDWTAAAVDVRCSWLLRQDGTDDVGDDEIVDSREVMS